MSLYSEAECREIIQWDANNRILVVADTDASNPRTNGDYMITGFAKIPGYGDSRKIDVAAMYETSIPIGDAFLRFNNALYDRGVRIGNTTNLTELTRRQVQRWARIFHNTKLLWDSPHGGFWFADEEQLALNWPGIEIPDGAVTYKDRQMQRGELEEIVIEQEQEQYRVWADGETEGWVHEVRTAWARVDQDAEGIYSLVNPLTDDDVREDWVEEDTLWGCAGYSDEERLAELPSVFDLPERQL